MVVLKCIVSCNYSVQHEGGNGDCSFKCLAAALNKGGHLRVRKNLVDHIVSEWSTYELWIIQTLGVVYTKLQYKAFMGQQGVFGSDVECRAASDFYKINIRLFRENADNTYFKQEYLTNVENADTINLLFSGMRVTGELDGHFQRLIPVENCADLVQENNSDDDENEATAFNNLSIAAENPSTTATMMSCDSSSSEEIRCKIPMKKKCSKSLQTEFKEQTGSSRYSVKEKLLMMKVHDFFEREKYEGQISIENVAQRMTQCLGISERIVYRLNNEALTGDIYNKPQQKCGRPKLEFDEFMQGVIRRKIYDFYMEKRHPAVRELLAKLRQDVPDLPDFSQSTLLRYLKKMNFVYKKINRKPMLFESKTVADHRVEYLQKIKLYREDSWNIFYTDETWCGAHHSKKFGWMERIIPDTNVDNFDYYRSRVQCVNGYRGGFVIPTGPGKRVIILHIGSKDGFLDGCLDCFVGTKSKTPNYHDEMNAEHFKAWFNRVLDVIPDKSVIVMDQAPYHTMIDEEFRNPTTAWSKSNIVQWLIKRKVPLPDDKQTFEECTRVQLLQLSKPYKYPKMYVLDKIAKERRGGSVRILWLPVAHCELNPIELIWAYVKNKVAKENSTFKVMDVLDLCEKTMNEIPSHIWPNCVRHVEELEDTFRKEEGMISQHVTPLVINVGGDGSSGTDSSDSDVSI